MKAKIIALPTEDQTNLVLDDKIWVYSEYGFSGDRLVKHHHLYLITPDAEINEGDIIIPNYTGRILECQNKIDRLQTGYNKVIASTDSSLCSSLIGEGVCREFCESENRKH